MIRMAMNAGSRAMNVVSAPIAARVKKEATIHPLFGSLVVTLAQANHRIYSHPVPLQPLTEEEAVHAGSHLVAKLAVSLAAGGVVIYQAGRNYNAESSDGQGKQESLTWLIQDILSGYCQLAKLKFTNYRLKSEGADLRRQLEISQKRVKLLEQEAAVAVEKETLRGGSAAIDLSD